MSISLTDGLVVMFRRIGHCDHRNSLLDFIVYERKVNRREKLHDRFFDTSRRMNDPTVVHKIEIIFNLKYPNHLSRSES